MPQKRNKPGVPPALIPRKLTSDDLWDSEALDHAARGVVQQLRRAYDGRPGRQIGQLVREEIRNIAQGAVSYWIAKRCEQFARQGGDPRKLDDWIVGRAEDPADLL